MSIPSPSILRSFAIVLVASLAFAWGEPEIRGMVAPVPTGPADVVAEARAGFAWFPFEVGRGELGADGGFSLTFREGPLPAEITVPLSSLFDGLRCEDLAVSDPAARVIVVRDLRVIPSGAACEYCETLGIIYAASSMRDSLAATGDVEVRWIHADRDVSVTGRCLYGWGREAYSLQLRTGWNTVVLETTAVEPSEGFCDCRDVNVAVGPLPGSITWHLLPER